MSLVVSACMLLFPGLVRCVKAISSSGGSRLNKSVVLTILIHYMFKQATAALLQTCWVIIVFVGSAVCLHRHNRQKFVNPICRMSSAIQRLAEIVYGKPVTLDMRGKSYLRQSTRDISIYNSVKLKADSSAQKSKKKSGKLALDFDLVDLEGLDEEDLVEKLMSKVNAIKKKLSAAEQMETVIGKGFTVQGVPRSVDNKPTATPRRMLQSLHIGSPSENMERKDASSLVSGLASGMGFLFHRTAALISSSKAGGAGLLAKSQDAEAAAKQAVKRRHIIKEIIESEKTYVRLLSIVVNSYLLPLEKMSEDDHTGIRKASVHALFANLKDILALHTLVIQYLLETFLFRYTFLIFISWLPQVSADLDPPAAGQSSSVLAGENPTLRIARVYACFFVRPPNCLKVSLLLQILLFCNSFYHLRALCLQL